MQCVFETIEDAGYTREAWPAPGGWPGRQRGSLCRGDVRRVPILRCSGTDPGSADCTWGFQSSIANRVSYWCNFHGPSMAIDTMCSSSITAMHTGLSESAARRMRVGDRRRSQYLNSSQQISDSCTGQVHIEQRAV